LTSAIMALELSFQRDEQIALDTREVFEFYTSALQAIEDQREKLRTIRRHLRKRQPRASVLHPYRRLEFGTAGKLALTSKNWV
jgi:hypothetical protein